MFTVIHISDVSGSSVTAAAAVVVVAATAAISADVISTDDAPSDKGR